MGTLQEVGIDPAQVKDVITTVGYSHGTHNLRSILVARHGKLVVEQYLNSYAVDTIHDVRSAGKTFTGALVGIAIDQGLIRGTSETVLALFGSPKGYANPGNGKEDITLENLLNMSSGMAADAYDVRTPGNELHLRESDDFVQFILDLPMSFPPGEKYQYNSAAAYLAGAAVERASGRTLSDFAAEHLFGPLGMSQYYWTKGPKNTTHGMGGLFVTARDFAKLGALYLNQGQWNGQQIISRQWVEESLRSRFPVDGPPFLQTGYGRFWLVADRDVFGKSYRVFYASGNGGNVVAIVPRLDLVVSIQQSAYGQGYPHFRAFSILDGMIKACVLGDR
ncbi:MAG: serine hydrolase [Acidobacteriota bacterium]